MFGFVSDLIRKYQHRDFVGFKSLTRISRPCIITEKIDGTNVHIYIKSNGTIKVGSRNEYLSEKNDQFGFYDWVMKNKDSVLKLGPGRHYGEWWGQGINRKYNMKSKQFSLFNVNRWCNSDSEPLVIKTENSEKIQTRLPDCINTVPVLYRGIFDTIIIDDCLDNLLKNGSYASPGFMKPEGICVFHIPSNTCFKKTLNGDGHKKEKMKSDN